jgi:hypothetical protein
MKIKFHHRYWGGTVKPYKRLFSILLPSPQTWEDLYNALGETWSSWRDSCLFFGLSSSHQRAAGWSTCKQAWDSFWPSCSGLCYTTHALRASSWESTGKWVQTVCGLQSFRNRFSPVNHLLDFGSFSLPCLLCIPFSLYYHSQKQSLGLLFSGSGFWNLIHLG